MHLRVHELLARLSEGGVRGALEAERRLVTVGDVSTANRARAVRRPQQRLVTQGQQPGLNRVEEDASIGARPLRVRQVRSACFPDEERVTREDAPGSSRDFVEVDGVRGALWRVPGGVQRHHLESPDSQLLSILHSDVRVAEQWVIERDDLRASQLRQLF